jgi:iron complex transport system substrate-binding protein
MRRWIAIFVLCLAARASAERRVTDQLGRTVTVPDHPHRLICLLPSVVDDVYALGAGGDVVAVSDYTKYPEAARSKPSIGPPLSPSLETIVSLHPDLILGGGDMNRAELIDRIEKLGIPVFLVEPHGIDGIYRSLADLGTALNREAAAKDLVTSLRQRESAVRAQAKGQSAVRVLVPVWYDPIVTIGSKAYITELVELAGAHSVTDDISQEWPQVSLETILARSPDALLLVKGSKMSLDSVRGRPGWDQLPAVKNDRVYYVSDKIEYPSPVAFDALEELVSELHPRDGRSILNH